MSGNKELNTNNFTDLVFRKNIRDSMNNFTIFFDFFFDYLLVELVGVDYTPSSGRQKNTMNTVIPYNVIKISMLAPKNDNPFFKTRRL